MTRFFLLIAALVLSACKVGPFPNDPTTAPSNWPVVDEPILAAAGASSCAAAIENGKRLGCPLDTGDAGACAALSTKQITCLSTATNCLAQSRCTEVGK